MTQRWRSFSVCSLLFLLMMLFFARSHAQDTSGQTIVASMAHKYTVSFKDLEEYVRDNYYTIRYPKNLTKAFSQALNDKIVRQLKLIDFFALGLGDSAELLPEMKRAINEELVIQYYNARYENRVIDEDSMKSAYKDMGREVFYRQIMLKKPADASPQALDSLIVLAQHIKTSLRSNANFAALAKQYSQGISPGRSGDELQSVDWKKSLTNDVYATIFREPVNEIRIIESTASIYIAKIVKIKKIPLPPYEKVKEDIRSTLSTKYKFYNYDWFEQEKKNLLDEKTAVWNSQGLQQLVQWSALPNFYQVLYTDTLRAAISQGNNFVILKHSKGTVDLKEYLRLLNDVLTWGKYVSINEEDIKKYILEAVRTDVIVTKARTFHLEKGILSPDTKNSVLRSGILFLYSRHEIEEHIPVPGEKDYRDFYEANKDSLYYQLAKVNISAVIDSKKSAVEGAKQKYAQNVPFEKLAPRIFLKAFRRGRDGVWRTYYGGNEPPYLSNAAMKLHLNETAGPVEYRDTATGIQYAFIKCIDRMEEKQLTFDEAKKTIADDYANYYRRKIAQSVEERLMKKYAVKIYKDVLDRKLLSIEQESQ